MARDEIESEDEKRGVTGLEIRQEGGRAPRLVGWAAVWDSRSENLGGFVEIIRRGAFKKTLDRGTDIMAFVEHDSKQIIARRSIPASMPGSLVIQEDSKGLRVEIHTIDTSAGEDVIKNVRAGILDSMSFAFRIHPEGEKWDFSADPPLRELLSVECREVSVVALPAYPSTEVALRSLAARRHEATRGRPVSVAERLRWEAEKMRVGR